MHSGIVNKISQHSIALDAVVGNQPRTVAQAARELNVAKSTVRAWIGQRKLGHVRLGRSIRVPAAEVQRLLEEGYTPARRA